MMQHQESRSRLNDFVDGTLTPAERDAVLDHLESCDECQTELAGLTSLLAEARALPREIAPSRDLWPDIAARLQDRSGPAGTEEAGKVIALEFGAASRRSRLRQWMPLAAAAMMLVVLSSGVTAYLMRAGEEAAVAVVRVPVPVQSRPATALAAFEPTEQEYLGAVEALELELAARREQLSPQTIATIEENLQIIDQAIGEARAALEKDPANADLPLLLSGVYRKKVELLQSALRIPSRSI